MNGVGIFLIFLFIIVLFVIIFAACYNTSCRRRKRCPVPIIDPCRKCIAHALRSQVTSTALPPVPVPSSSPLDVAFTSPSASSFVEIPEDGHYRISYSVQLSWCQEAGASACIHAIYPDSTPDADILGSQQQSYQTTVVIDPISHSFVNYFPCGTQLFLRVQATADDAVAIPASDSTTLLVPTTLASIYATQV